MRPALQGRRFRRMSKVVYLDKVNFSEKRPALGVYTRRAADRQGRIGAEGSGLGVIRRIDYWTTQHNA